MAEDDRLANPAYAWNQLDYGHDALIEASAGTGKTHALESIVLKLICDRGYDAKEILLVTFTEKAAGELKDRVRKALAKAGRLPSDFDEMTICTIHSFCRRLLDEYAFENGVPMRSEVCSGAAALSRRAVVAALRDEAFCGEYGADLYGAMKKAGFNSVEALVGNVCRIVDGANRARSEREMERLIEAKKGVQGDKATEARRMLLKLTRLSGERFDALKRDAALMTFDDMVARAAEVVTREPRTDDERKAKARLFSSIRERYRVALVDEFQDTDQEQWDIFRSLFSSSVNVVEGGRPGFLVVVGDPKQAIYSFRGADVRVYCSARDEILAGGESRRKTLRETYRARRSLVDALNALFRDAGGGAPGSDWFKGGAGGVGISYSDVSYPAKGNCKFDRIADEASHAPVLLLESMPDGCKPSQARFGNKTTCLPVFADSAAQEMKRLVGLVPAYALKGEGAGDPPPRFRYGDMCVLVGTRNDAAVVRRVLARHGIPYGQYKQPGLYDSPEAEGVLALLDYLAEPSGLGNRAALLMSPLFGLHPSKAASPPPEAEIAFDALVERLQCLVRDGNWSGLFEAVMSDECTALVHPRQDLCAFNRTRAAVRQIFDALLVECGRRVEGPAAVAEMLRKWRRNDEAAGENGSLYGKESAADHVQIMTMHASKGLQFPIVFLAYGFSSQVKRGTPEEQKVLAKEECRRLAYVALTRAEYRLYLPWSRRAWEWQTETDGKGRSAGGAGIGSSGSALLVTKSAPGFLGNAILSYFEGRHDAAFAPGQDHDGGTEAERQTPQPAPPAKGEADGDAAARSIALLDIPDLKNRRVQWDSFTSVQRRLSAATPVDAEDREVVAETDARLEAEPQCRPVMEKTLLPRGNVAGNVFHEVMEALCKNDAERGEVDFSTACDDCMSEDSSPLMALIRQKMLGNRLANREDGGDSTERTLLRMVQAALRTEVTIGRCSFRLKDIPRKDRLAEVEFVLSEGRLLADLPPGRDGVLNGKIDLVVRIGDRVFILDWKTNSLSCYADESVVRDAMDEAGYHLQYQLYSLAMSAWTERRGLSLAGVAYLFVRGGEHGAESGVFAEAFDGASVGRFRDGVLRSGIFTAGEGAHDGV